MLRTMLTAYMTALGTQSSAATIPVTLAQTVKLGVRPELASFVVPLCATIHLSGSMMKITACALAVSMIAGWTFRVDLRGVHPAAGRDDGGGSGRAGRGDHGGAGTVGVDARFRRDPQRG